MKTKLAKIMTIIFLLLLTLGGGVLFAACGKEPPKASVSITSQDIGEDGVVQIDLAGVNKTASISAVVSGVKSGGVWVNNDSPSIVSTKTTYKETNNTNTITITGLREGKAQLEVRSLEGSGRAVVDVFVYSDIVGMSQKEDVEGKKATQFVVRTQPLKLTADRFLNFISAEGCNSNRTDVTWKTDSVDPNITLENDVLTVGENYAGEQITLKAESVYTEYNCEVTLDVINQLPVIDTLFSRDVNAFNEPAVGPYNIVRNDHYNEEATGYVKLDYVFNQTLSVNPIVKDANGNIVTGIVDVGKFGDTGYVYKLQATDTTVKPGIYYVSFEASYEKYDYSTETVPFAVQIVDVINQIEVTNNGLNVIEGQTFDIYNNYNAETEFQFGQPLKVQLSPASVSNDKATFIFDFGVNDPRTTLDLYDERGKQIEIVGEGGKFTSKPIQNKSIIYIRAKEGSEGKTLAAKIASTQSPNVNLTINLKFYKSPNSNFSIGGNQKIYLPTFEKTTKRVTFSAAALAGVESGVELSYANNPNYEITNFTFESTTGRGSFDVTNTKTNIFGKEAILNISLKHKNGFTSTESVNIEGFVPMQKASVTYDGQSVVSVSHAAHEYQEFNGGGDEGGYFVLDTPAYKTRTLQSLIMTFGSSVQLKVSSNYAISSSFKFVENENAVSDWMNNKSFEELNVLVRELITSQASALVSFNSSTGFMTLPSQSIKGYVLMTIRGYDSDHNTINIYRVFYLESYIAPTKLMPNPEIVNLTAKDSLFSEDSDRSKLSLTLKYRLDSNEISYADKSNFKFYSSANPEKEWFANDKNAVTDYNYHLENLIISGSMLSFDIIADTTFGWNNWTDKLIIEYQQFGVKQYGQVEINIKNASRVENLSWRNRPSDGLIYLDLYSEEVTARTFGLVTSIEPLTAENKDLYYTFAALPGTEADLVNVNELGIVSFKSGATKGGHGHVYALPKDAIQNIGGVDCISFYIADENGETMRQVKLTDLDKEYSLLQKGYFKKQVVENVKHILLNNIILKMPVMVADGLSEDTPIRIYNEEGLKSINLKLHYELMSSLILSDWESFSGEFTGSLRGNNKEISIHFTNSDASLSQPLFDKIAKDGKVTNLTISGNVQGGGFIANTNAGTIENIKIVVFNSGKDEVKIASSKVVNNGLVGAIAGENSGLIKDVLLEGVSVHSETDYAGGVVGSNSGTIDNARVEFYIFSQETTGDKTTDITNTITTGKTPINKFNQGVGAIVGYHSGVIKNSYAYNYSSANVFGFSQDFDKEDGIDDSQFGHFAAEYENGKVENSFAVLGHIYTDQGVQDFNDEYGKNIYTDVYIEDIEYKNNNERWIIPGAEGYLSYVRKQDFEGEQPHLKFYQAEAVTDINIQVQDTNKSLKVGDNSAILYKTALLNPAGLTNQQISELEKLNTISLSEFLGEGANTLVASSSNNTIVEIRGSNIYIKDKGDFNLTLLSKQNYSLSKTLTIKVIYAINEFSISQNGIETSGFSMQEGTSTEVSYAIKDGIYLSSATKYAILQNPNEIKAEVGEEAQDLAEILISGPTGIISLKNGIVDLLKEHNGKFNITSYYTVPSLEGEFFDAVKQANTRNLSIIPYKGIRGILTNYESLSIDPASSVNLNVVLKTDGEEDELVVEVSKNENKLSTKIDTKTEKVFSYAGEEVLRIKISEKEFDKEKLSREYNLNISVAENYRHKIFDNEEYSLELTSTSGIKSGVSKSVGLTLTRQSINYISMTNYKSATSSFEDGKLVYNRTNEAVSVISPGSASIFNVSIDPEYAYYEYMTLTAQNADGAVLHITSLNRKGETSYVADSSNNSSIFEGGMRVNRKEDGQYDFRIYAAANIAMDTVFNLTATFYDKNAKPLSVTATSQIFISYLPSAELTVDGLISTALAKGGTASLQITLKNDQELESLVPTGTKGINISPKSTWISKDNGNGTKTMTAMLRASLDAGVLDENGNAKNVQFEIVATVARIFNGVRETKISKAYVTVVDILPTGAKVMDAKYENGQEIGVISSYIGISTQIEFEYSFNPEAYNFDPSDESLVKELQKARNTFVKNGYLEETDSGFAINYTRVQGEKEKIIPIYERLYYNNTKIEFKESNKTDDYTEYTATISVDGAARFKLVYRDSKIDSQKDQLTAMGLSATARPVEIELRDYIYVSGKTEEYKEISSKFAVNVEVYSDQDLPLMIETSEEFIAAAASGTVQDYILMNDITLTDYTPVSAAMMRSLDGNGYTIHIESFNVTGSGSINLALFSDIPSTSTIKNLKVNLYNGGNITIDTTSTGFNNISVAGFAINNAGVITNCEVIAYQNSGATLSEESGIKVNLVKGSTPYYIDSTSSVIAQIAGFVINNTGNITNSRVGGQEIIVIGEQVGSSNVTYYRTQKLGTFTIIGQGSMAGFVLNNSGEIAASGVSQLQLTNKSTSNKLTTAGFVVSNSGKIRTSYVEGVEGSDKEKLYHLDGSNITSFGIVAGFVGQNTKSGYISDGYSNIFISSATAEKSRTSAGFVYQNEGYISTSYSASLVEKSNILQLNFSGVDRNGNSLNTGVINLSYYYIRDAIDDESGDLQPVVSNQASLILRDEVDKENAYYGFIFSSSLDSENGIWRLRENKGVELVCKDMVTVSHRYYVPISSDEYMLPYAILEDINDEKPNYNTGYGNKVNPILIGTATDFKDAMGNAKSTYISSFFNDTHIFGSYRFVSDIDLSLLNNELGNAQIKSIDRIFTGRLDGNGFTIRNISIASTNNTVGLFGQMNGAFVQNFNIEVDNVTSANAYMVGGLAGLVKDSTITNVTLTQLVNSTTMSGKGVLGRNIVGGIIGAAFGDTHLTGLTADGAVVNASYFARRIDEGSIVNYRTFDPVEIRKNERQNRTKLFSSTGAGSTGDLSFAGGIVGYLDTYNSLEVTRSSFFYNANLASKDYTTKKLLAKGSIDVRGEVVGGVAGYTGFQTKAQDIGLQIGKGETGYAHILSYNYYAGGLFGLANGQLYQIYAEHDPETQARIESSTASYYKSGSLSAERGHLNLFRYTDTSVGSYEYRPAFVGGIAGALGSSSIKVGYSKINAINYSDNGAYAGGLAGVLISGGENTVEDGKTNHQATHILNEVYVSGDVYSHSKTNNQNYFAGLFGLFDIKESVKNSLVKLSMSSVNAVNHYGVLENDFVADSNAIDNVYAVVDKHNGGIITVFPAALKDGNEDGEARTIKAFGYMSNYSRGETPVIVTPYDGFIDNVTENPSSKYYFKITSVANFENVEDGYSETNGAFINSLAWSNKNWNHTKQTLYPTINFVNAVNYIYLDQDNITSVINKMKNSSIEVRIRGRKNGAIEGNVGHVDLRGYENAISGFSGRFVGATANEATSWGVDKVTYISKNQESQTISAYPGIIIDSPIFMQTGTGVRFENVNIIIDKDKKLETDNDKQIVNQYGAMFISDQVNGARFDNNHIYLFDEIIFNITNNKIVDVGLFATSAISSSFRSNTIEFVGNPGGASGSGAVWITVNNATKGSTETGKTKDNPGESINVKRANVGLLTGSLRQISSYEAARVQDNIITHNGGNTLLNVDIQAEELNVGMLVGHISNIKKYANASQENQDESQSTQDEIEQNVASVIISAEAPVNNVPSAKAAEDNNAFNTEIMLGKNSSSKITNFGGLFGLLEAFDTQITFNKNQAYNQNIVFVNQGTRGGVAKANEEIAFNMGAIAGNAVLTDFKFNTKEDDAIKSKMMLSGEFKFSETSLNSINLGTMFGRLEGSATISQTNAGIAGKITTTPIKTTNDKQETESSLSLGNAKIGGLIGNNEASLIINDATVTMDVGEEGSKSLNGEVAESNADKMQENTNNDKPVSATSVDFGGFVGSSSNLIVLGDGELLFNNGKKPMNIAFETVDSKSTTKNADLSINYGGIVGALTGSAELSVKRFETNEMALIKADNVNAGSLVGYADGTTKISTKSDITIGKIHSKSNYLIDAKTVNAGGMIGLIGNVTDENTGTFEINDTFFGGAFKFGGDRLNGGTHIVGGVVGNTNMPATIANNEIYGDAIYSYNKDNTENRLSSYTFGGVLGTYSIGDDNVNENNKPTINSNVIAFTNNNPQLSDTHQTSALVGNGDGMATIGNITTGTTTVNFYSSQLVLATSENAIDLGYCKANENGYIDTVKNKGELQKSTIISKFHEVVEEVSVGSKLKPITAESEVTAESEEEKASKTTNGITYYAGIYPTQTREEGEVTNSKAVAIIGDFVKQDQKPLKELGQYSFISGVMNNFSRDASLDNKDENKGEETIGKEIIFGGLVNQLNGGIIFASGTSGKISLGGTATANMGGLVGKMSGGLISESSSALDIVYRAGNTKADDGKASGNAAGIAVLDNTYLNSFDGVYSTGEVASYISANLYAFTNATVKPGDPDKNLTAIVRDSYTISNINQKDFTQASVGGSEDVFGKIDALSGVQFDKNAVQRVLTEEEQKLLKKKNISDALKPKVETLGVNYGYPTRNFKAFKIDTKVKDKEGNTFYLVPNASVFKEMNMNCNYKLIRDIDLSKTDLAKEIGDSNRLVDIFDGDGHTINGNTATLFESAGTLKNLRVTNADVTGTATVATSVITANNVIATGLLKSGSGKDDATNMGGLFATAGKISNCSNYVKIENSKYTRVGGIVGTATGEIRNCKNYAPINSTKAESHVGGIVGQATATISNCRNENTVFNGYTDGDNGNYYAGGIAGQASADITGCTNTGMIKAGNKNINAGTIENGVVKNDYVAYAAGIVAASTSGSITDAANYGFVEALGSTANIENYNSFRDCTNASKDTTEMSISINNNNGGITNVAASSFGLNGTTRAGKGTTSTKLARNNGLFGKQTIDNVKIKVPEYEPGTDVSRSFKVNGITISSKGKKFETSETDELGGITNFYIKSVRNLNYNGITDKEQTRYYSYISGLETSYSDESWVVEESEQQVSQTYSLQAEKEENATPTQVKIGGKLYAFTENKGQLEAALASNSYTANVAEPITTISDKTISELNAAGYSFEVRNIKATYNGQTLTATANIENTGTALNISFVYNGADDLKDQPDINITYEVVAYKPVLKETVTLRQTNFKLEGNKVIFRHGFGAIEAGTQVQMRLNSPSDTTVYEFTVNTNDTSLMTYTATAAEAKALYDVLLTKAKSTNKNIYLTLIGASITEKFTEYPDSMAVNLSEDKYEIPETKDYKSESFTNREHWTEVKSTSGYNDIVTYSLITEHNIDDGTMVGVQYEATIQGHWKEFYIGFASRAGLEDIYIHEGQKSETINNVTIEKKLSYNDQTKFTTVIYRALSYANKPEINNIYNAFKNSIDGISDGLHKEYLNIKFSDMSLTQIQELDKQYNSKETKPKDITVDKDHISYTVSYDYTNRQKVYDSSTTNPTTGVQTSEWHYEHKYKRKITITIKDEKVILYGDIDKFTYDKATKTYTLKDESKDGKFDKLDITQKVYNYETLENMSISTNIPKSGQITDKSGTIITNNLVVYNKDKVIKPTGGTVLGKTYTINNDEAGSITIEGNKYTPNTENNKITIEGTEYTFAGLEFGAFAIFSYGDESKPQSVVGTINLQLDGQTVTVTTNIQENGGISFTIDGASFGDQKPTFDYNDKKYVLVDYRNVFSIAPVEEISEDGYIHSLQAAYRYKKDGTLEFTEGDNSWVPSEEILAGTKFGLVDNLTETTIDSNNIEMTDVGDFKQANISGLSLKPYQYINLDIKYKDDGEATPVELIFDTYNIKSVQGSSFIESVEGTLNGAPDDTISNNFSASSDFGGQKVYGLNIQFQEFNTGKQEIGHTHDSGKKQNYAGIVLTKDIDLENLTTSYQYNKNLTSKNNNIISYTNLSGTATSLLSTGDANAFIKDISVAASAGAENTAITSLLATEFNCGNISNVNVYGTMINNYSQSVDIGGVFDSITGATINGLNSYVSVSNPNNTSFNVAGVANTINGGTLSNINFYGAIIGVRGADGASAGAAGEAGQNVYALYVNRNANSAENVNLAHRYDAKAGEQTEDLTTLNNYGILRAGDGGNGRRKDGTGGKDTFSKSYAPTNGSYGTSSKGGNGGIAYLYGKEEATSSQNVLKSNPGKAGSHGNDGWGGVNLIYYQRNNIDGDYYNYRNERQWVFPNASVGTEYPELILVGIEYTEDYHFSINTTDHSYVTIWLNDNAANNVKKERFITHGVCYVGLELDAYRMTHWVNFETPSQNYYRCYIVGGVTSAVCYDIDGEKI